MMPPLSMGMLPVANHGSHALLELMIENHVDNPLEEDEAKTPPPPDMGLKRAPTGDEILVS